MNKIISLAILLIPALGVAQEAIQLVVRDQSEEVVPYADIRIDETILLQTDSSGLATTRLNPGKHEMEINAFGYRGFKSVFTVVDGKADYTFSMESLEEMDEVVVSGTLAEISKSESPVAITILTPKFFSKNPEPSMYGVIDQVNGVRTQLNCNVCNTGDIHINGMEGPYTMITIDGMPIVGGLSTVYGLQGIPANLIERIEVIKGPASTLYGSEAVGGLINVITKNPSSADKFSMNVSMSSYLEGNIDVGYTAKMGKVSTILGANYFKYGNPVDLNNDNFTDVTLQDRISVFNKWSFERKENRVANVAFRYVYEDRWGGEMQWTPEFRGGDSIYGESIWTNRYEMIGNYQLPTKEKILFQTSLSKHLQNSVYGDMPYIADQVIAFNQLHWTKTWGVNHFLVGAAHRYTYYDDNTTATSITQDSITSNDPSRVGLPGIFVQDLIKFDKRNHLLLGARIDFHPQHGNVISPRVNYKLSPTDKFDVRMSVGNGFRVVNLFAEEHAALTGAREVVILESLKPEQSYNATLNVTKKFLTNAGLFTIDGNLFYTYFTNKINPDYDSNDDQIIYENLDGYAIYRGINIDTRFKFEFPLTINAGITFLDAFEMNLQADGTYLKEIPMLTEGLSGSFSASYTFRKWDVSLDYSSVFYGPMRLPILENDFRPEFSDTYAIHNLKLSKSFGKKVELYCGVKNIFNFMPPANSIMRPFDPFDKEADDPVSNPNGYTFDPAYVYAPNQGVRGYVGAKFLLNK